jgi:electron transfer flavoprotein beta subunit
MCPLRKRRGAVKALVLIQPTAKLDEDFELRGDRLDVDGDCVDWIVNDRQWFALEAALRICESEEPAGEAVAVSVGDSEVEETLRTALALGASRAVQIRAGQFDRDEPLAIARTLAPLVHREEPDLVLGGLEPDAAHAATAMGLAGVLGWPHLAAARTVEYSGSTRTTVVERELEGGVLQRMMLRGPAVITIGEGAREPRPLMLRAKIRAGEQPLEVLECGALGLDPGALEGAAGGRRLRMYLPEAHPPAELIDGGPEDVARRIHELIRDGLR